MPWWTGCVCALSWVLLGCPEVHRRDGLVDRAAHEDVLEGLPSRCSLAELKKYCGDGRNESPECRRHCGDIE